jgi:hypothetical protein
MVTMKQWLLYPALASVVTLVLHFAVGLRFGVSAFVAFLAWPALGTLVTVDDDLPGGWSNPDGDITPPWRTKLFWGQLAGGCAVSALVAALDVGALTPTGIGFACVGVVAGSIAIALLRHQSQSHDITADRL